MANRFDEFRLFLSASVPEEKRDKKYLTAHLSAEDRQVIYTNIAGEEKTLTKIPNAQLQMEETVICLARAVFANGGQLVFGGHPSISPLVSVISEEYVEDEEETGDGAPGREIMQGDNYTFSDKNCPPVVIYQSRIYEQSISNETRQMLTQGHAFIRWTEEQWEDKTLDLTGKSKNPNSIAYMRDQMIFENDLDGMVCVGGMEGVEQEVDRFITKYGRTKPIFIFQTTGGASALLASDEKLKARGQIIVVDNAQGQDKRDSYGLLSSATYLAAAHEIVQAILVSKQ